MNGLVTSLQKLRARSVRFRMTSVIASVAIASAWLGSPLATQTAAALSSPDAPSGVSASAADASAIVSWGAPADNGSAITSYTVTPVLGAVAQAATTVSGSPPVTVALVAGLTNGAAYTFVVSATNDGGTGAGSAPSNAVTPSVASSHTLFGTAAPAGAADGGDAGANVELGMKFTADVSGFVTGVRFYKFAANTGMHTGSLWSSGGTRLATATFGGESASGWQQVSFSPPVAVTQGTTYVASYHTTVGHYSFSGNAFGVAIDNAPLHGLAGGASGGNGVFLYGASGFPNQAYNSANYGVDPIFAASGVAATAPGAPTGVTASPGDSSAIVSWVAPANNGDAISSYTVTPFVGATAQPPTTVAGSPPATSTTISGLTNGTAYTFKVSATNSVGTGPASGASTPVTPAGGSSSYTLFGQTVPATPDGGDAGANVELGVKFTADVAGFVSGVRFYKFTTNTGTHTGSLWSTGGTRLATATFTSESASGWQQVTFSAPVAVTAGATYVASYHTTAGHYSFTGNAFGTPFDNAPLHAPASGASGGNGVFIYGPSAFPNQSYNAANYSVDVNFTPSLTSATAPAAPTGVSATAGDASAIVSWAVPANNGSPIAAYTVTPFVGSVAQTATSVSGAPPATTATISGLTNGTTYTFEVTATNGVGAGPASAPSGAVTPTAGSSSCSCTLFGAAAPSGAVDGGDTGANVELGVKFTTDVPGFVTGVRFYKFGANSGTHTGSLWSSAGALLASATFSNESGTGWQKVTFGSPVAILPGTTYVASYHTTAGHYTFSGNAFATPFDNAPLHAPASGTSGGNGVFAYGASAFPNQSYNAANYGVDLVFSPDTTAPVVASTVPAAGATNVAASVTPSATFSKNIQPGTVVFTFRDAANTPVAGSVAVVGNIATFTPSAQLAPGVTFTATVSGAKDLAGNVLAGSVSWSFTSAVPAGPGQVGQWGALQAWPLVSIHTVSLNNGDVLAVDGWQTPTAYPEVFHPDTNTFTVSPVSSGIFCAGNVTLADGRVMMAGGFTTTATGTKSVNFFDPNTETWTPGPDMHLARWYPSATVLPDGRVLVISGNIDPTHWADTPEVYDPTTNTWTLLPGIDTGMIHSTEYPLTYTMPDGRVFVITPNSGEGLIIDVDAQTITSVGFSGLTFGSATMYSPGKVLYTGGGDALESPNPSSAEALTIDLTQPNPSWQSISPMNHGRVFHSLVDLPDGNVLVVGGGQDMRSGSNGVAVLAAEEWNPTTGVWTQLADMDPTVMRLYHSTAILMPDGRVLVSGGGHNNVNGAGYGEFSAQYFSPPYLFNGAQPTITSAPTTTTFGSTITVQTPDAANITSVSLLGLSTSTHTSNMNTGYVPLNFSAGAGSLSVQMPPNGNYASPGEYRLTIKKANGTPSVGRLIRITGVPGKPSAVTAVPAGNAAATVSWSPPGDGGSAITQYTVTPYIGAAAQAPTIVNSAAATSTTVTGLTNESTYTFTVKATNASGTGAESTHSSPVTPTATPAMPGAPTSVNVTLGPIGPIVTWAAPASPGATITSYTVTPFRGATPLTPTVVNGSPPVASTLVSGLCDGATYTFTVTATNSVGTSPASTPSNALCSDITVHVVRNVPARATGRWRLGCQGQPGRQVQRGRLGIHHRHPVLQDRRQHRNAPRGLVVVDRNPARGGHLRRRVRYRMAAGDVLVAGAGDRRHDLRRRLPHDRGPLLLLRERLRGRLRQRAAPCARRRGLRGQRRVRLRGGRFPHAKLQRRELLGRCHLCTVVTHGVIGPRHHEHHLSRARRLRHRGGVNAHPRRPVVLPGVPRQLVPRARQPVSARRGRGSAVRPRLRVARSRGPLRQDLSRSSRARHAGAVREVPLRGLLSSWRSLGFSDITLVDHGDSVTVAPGVVATVLCDTSHREDSALMLDVDGFTFLDLNDCLVQFGELPADVDILTRQFSGAMWYPNCYRYPPDVLAQKVSTVRRNLLQTLVTTCEATTPGWYVPSAGPACFLDPELQHFNDREKTIFPAWEDVADDFAAACPTVDVLRVMPGDRIEVRGGVPQVLERSRPTHAAVMDLASYSATRVHEYSALRNDAKPPVTFDELHAHLIERQRKCKPLLEDCDKRVRISTEQRSWTFTLRAEPEIELVEAAPAADAEYSFVMPEWVLREIVDGDIWEEALLSMRITLERNPDEFDVRLLGFLRYGHQRPVVQRLVSDIKSSDETIERDGLRLQRFCPHSGEDLTHAIICDGIVECPRHHWKWDATSGKCIEGGTLPLARRTDRTGRGRTAQGAGRVNAQLDLASDDLMSAGHARLLLHRSSTRSAPSLSVETRGAS